MEIESIPIITVSYNAPDLIADLLRSLRRHYGNKVYVIDGSAAEHAPDIAAVVAAYPNTEFIHFDYNIHHGPGMAWAISNLELAGPVLVMDSDVSVLHEGFIEALRTELEPGMYGVGQLNYVDRGGFDVADYLSPMPEGALRYLHPALMLCNIEVVRKWPLPVKHGAPMIETMAALHDAGQAATLLHHVDWVRADFAKPPAERYIRHDWQGTVGRTGGYHLEEWQASLLQGRQPQTAAPGAAARADPAAAAAPAYDAYHHDLLTLMPDSVRGVFQIGCDDMTLAALFKAGRPSTVYAGIEADAAVAERARSQCDQIVQVDIETVNAAFFASYAGSVNVWVFGNVLQRLRDPWSVLVRLRQALPPDGCILVCLPNAQHWSLQARLNAGDLRYAESSLLSQKDLRWFTRVTMLEMVNGAGLRVEQGFARLGGALENDGLINAIKLMASATGVDPDIALQDALPLQYLTRLRPA